MAMSQIVPPDDPALARPLRGGALVLIGSIVWLTGAAYCHGYERLLSGGGDWTGSLVWSAIAVLPWFALFEWSKTERGRSVASWPGKLAFALLVTAALSLGLELALNAAQNHAGSPVGLTMLRRLPAIGASLVLILWAAASHRRRMDGLVDREGQTDLSELAALIDWVAAADNYIELHFGNRTVLRRMTMREAERQLSGFGFVRIHRRYLINGRKLESSMGSNGDRRVRVAGAELPVGSRYASALRQ